jgi:hypothetical protein
VLCQSAFTAGAKVAMCAPEALLSSVHQHVLGKGALATGTKVAMCAPEALLSSVHQHVLGKGALATGAKVAVGALKGFLSGVHQQVLGQVALATGTKVAVGAQVSRHLTRHAVAASHPWRRTRARCMVECRNCKLPMDRRAGGEPGDRRGGGRTLGLMLKGSILAYMQQARGSRHLFRSWAEPYEFQ